ncbi:MAG: NAD-dependent epimerase/dehydratase family protein [Deltaproteobacteria bacterium]|nr:NAD-dependent epimerase/dehydratase family protein [Myxococcales bacterium]MDP3216349.1 NAD-dependent epimerase/dehydratase family protein [Deltaproteobacteria bacterium]
MKVFVTGGSGFVGGHVIEALAPAHEVRAMARSAPSAEAVSRYGATAVRADLDAVGPEHLAGCDAVVHCAAYVEEWGTREQFWKGNVEGTTRMLDAARRAGVRRFVHIGTEAALFDGHDLVDIDERHPYPAVQKYLYSETKAEAERRVFAANAEGFATLSVRPRFVWGPRDTSVLPAVLRMAREGAWVWLDGGRARTSTTHVLNLARAVELALTAGEGGEAYFVADEGTRTLREFLTAMARTQGVELPERSMPGAVARPMASALEAAWRALEIKRPPPMTAFAIAMMSREVTVNTAKARRALGYAPVIDVAAGIAALG